MANRGAVAPGKRQVNWRIRADLLEKLQAEAAKRGLAWPGNSGAPAMIEAILSDRYYQK
jgi:hypothetical protein